MNVDIITVLFEKPVTVRRTGSQALKKVQDVAKNVTLIKIEYLKKDSTGKTLMVLYSLKCLIMNGTGGSGIPFELEFLRHLI